MTRLLTAFLRFHRRITLLIAVAATALLPVANAFADSGAVPTAHRTELTIQGLSEALVQHRRLGRRHGAPRKESVPLVRVDARIRGEGWVRGEFRIRRNQDSRATFTTPGGIVEDLANPLLLQGTVTTSRGTGPAALAVLQTDGVRRLSMTFRGKRRGSARRSRSIELQAVLARNGALHAWVRRIPVSFSGPRSCGTEYDPASPPSKDPSNPDSGPPITVETLRVLEIATDADAEWFTQFGTSSNEHILGIINAVEPIYERDLGITFSVTTQNVFQTNGPYLATAAGTLLDQFVDYSEANQQLGSADAKHLFTGKNLDGSTVGIAYVGQICRFNGANSYAITQRVANTIDTQTFAHEVGHNLGSPHDNTDPGSIMWPSVSNPASTYFSPLSIGQIASYVATYGACMAVTGSGPTPTPTATPTPTTTRTPSITPTNNPNATATPVPSATPTSTPQPSPPPAPIPTATPLPTATPYGSITLDARRIANDRLRLSGTVRTSAGLPRAGELVSILRNDRSIGFANTDRFGAYAVRVPAPTNKKVNFETRLQFHQEIRSSRINVRAKR